MGYRHQGPVQTLRDALDARIMLWVFCLNCGHRIRQHPWVWSQKLGPVPLQEAAQKSRCRACGKADCVLLPSREVDYGGRR
jgi:hypothetical protein